MMAERVADVNGQKDEVKHVRLKAAATKEY